MADISNVELRTTTGGLGGAIQTPVILSQSVTPTISLAGVTLVDAAGNGEGTGTLTYSATPKTLVWTPPSGTIGTPVTVGADGRFVVRGAGAQAGYLILDIVYANLITNPDTTLSLTTATRMTQLFDDVDKDEALAGDTEYRCFYIKNRSGSTSLATVKIWIAEDATGADSIAIGVDPAGVGGTATTIVNENTAPAGVTFSTPVSEGAALSVGTITASSYAAIWVRRTVPAASSSTTFDVARLRMSMLV